MKKKKTYRPFEGQIQQLRRETLVLVNFKKAKAFVDECTIRGIAVGVGGSHNEGIIIYKK